jgi:hypothetical protein
MASTSKTSRAENIARWTIVVVLLLVYVLVRIWLYVIADEGVSEPLWSRYTFIAGSFDSVVTVGVGWLFGREVHRKAYEDAKQRESDARVRDTANERHARNGVGLATALRGITADNTTSDAGHFVHQVTSLVEQFFPDEGATASCDVS